MPGDLIDRLLNFGMTDADAEQRWRKNNEAARKAGCMCGKPASVVRTTKVVGSVPAETWTCDDHAGADAWSGQIGGPMRAMWKHPEPCLDGYYGSSGPIGGPRDQWFCYHKSGGHDAG